MALDKNTLIGVVIGVVVTSFAFVFFATMTPDLFYVAAPREHKGTSQVITETEEQKNLRAALMPTLFKVGPEPNLNWAANLPLLPPKDPETCEYMEGHPQSSRPGVPCLPYTPKKFWPWNKKTQWRIDLGERLLKAVTPKIEDHMCDGFFLFGDQTWCNKAFDNDRAKKEFIGLSYGIEGRDMWSETMSNKYKMRTKLFDCYQRPDDSPPLGGKVPNGTKPCSEKPGSGDFCYAMPYDPQEICLGPTAQIKDGRKFITLGSSLVGRAPLSVHLKIDVEGCEWTSLEQLMDSPDHIKIRTLDMEIHFGWGAEADLSPAVAKLSLQERLSREIGIMERLSEHFYCTGSTLEVYREGWHPQECKPPNLCNEPVLYLERGFSVSMFAISYVNRNLLAD